MPGKVISGEIEPCADQGVRAAKTLQQLGFRVLHIGPTISVQAAQELWEGWKLRSLNLSSEDGDGKVVQTA